MTTERVKVTLFKRGGKYYTEEEWRVPTDAIGPYDMHRSLDFRRIENGPVLVQSQEPWGYPHLFPGMPEKEASMEEQGYVSPFDQDEAEEVAILRDPMSRSDALIMAKTMADELCAAPMKSNGYAVDGWKAPTLTERTDAILRLAYYLCGTKGS